ncbi:putative cytosol aminopeptidase [Nocardioides baekrokdamisoli]|uniref:Probable cytosol aminopeptidase n=1 Tax=Nocardioides baekrokdamisoli TaxID=1804624 RepID=A0A3G9IUF4_9ACTN|nr:leucyl aminopeptidase [Nocardioides baekrokdamisoli]BBH15823.1 putative cytosol aminopeptidase [Nocardioides baekrokdamisoli]
MGYTLRSASPARTRAEAVVIGLLQGDNAASIAPGGEDLATAYGRRLRGLLATLGATGKAGEVLRVPVNDEVSASLVVFVGLGPAVTADAVRAAAGVAARAVPNATSVALALPADSPALINAIVEGHILGGYTYTPYKSAPAPEKPGQISVLTEHPKDEANQAALAWAETVAAAVAATRDWVNQPPNDLTPPAFADAIVAAVASVPSVTAHVYAEKALEKIGAGGILGVGLSSPAAPRLVELRYAPEGATTHLALVGKGITFDSGGLNLKPGSSMKTMKSDMAGAAAVVQATLAIAARGLPLTISTFVPIAENAISATSMRPGDVITQYDGTTVEILDTDAEGRLLLADALGRAVESGPDVVIDVATLTGAMVSALGDRITGAMGSAELVDALVEAGAGAGEALWPMPIPDAIVDRVHKSTVADLLQVDGIGWGGGLYAAAFLREFVGGHTWAHLDIAGSSWNAGGAYGAVSAGGTGAAVATLIAYARGLAAAE